MEQVTVETVEVLEAQEDSAVQELSLNELALVGGGSVIMCMD